MSQLIYIRVSYNTGVALPISVLPELPKILVLHNEGYGEIKGLTLDKDYKQEFQLIDSMDIDKETRKQAYIKELQEDLAKNQAALDEAMR